MARKGRCCREVGSGRRKSGGRSRRTYLEDVPDLAHGHCPAGTQGELPHTGAHTGGRKYSVVQPDMDYQALAVTVYSYYLGRRESESLSYSEQGVGSSSPMGRGEEEGREGRGGGENFHIP